MKFYLALLLCAVVAAAPSEKAQPQFTDLLEEFSRTNDRSFLVNALVRQLFTYLRFVINNGSAIFGTPPLDPLILDHYHLYIPAGLINLDLDLKNIRATGFGGFVVVTSNLNLSTMTFDVEILFPELDITAEHYDLKGDLYTAIPLYGKGHARFLVKNFVFSAKLFLKQSEDQKSILIDRIENPSFNIPSFKAAMTGAIGGGDIDAIVNAITEDVIIGYVNRFQAVIASYTAAGVVILGNPILDTLDTWRFISPLMPRTNEE
ncbi:uncharacterized protein LOC114352176 [Ostrinia furnacalis]|uniref:uncharacterized protein LOC114352176 n=1 Tax=Ostrinia furnacalis TaxID=93504 RepID=UPI00103FD408|nr:uncharacterized protein LOC114352176 [Ostrinia furnacalis]